MVRLIVYNIEYCEGMTGKWWQYFKFWKIFFPPKGLDYRIVRTLKKFHPDILALIEVDTGSFRARKNEVVYFLEYMGMKDFVEKIKYPFKGYLKLFHYMPILKRQANALLSKKKLYDVKYHVLHEGTKRMIIEASVNVPKKVTLLLAHLSLRGWIRRRQLDELVKIVKNIKSPVILMGDFNTYRGEREIRKLLKNTGLKHRYHMTDGEFTFTQPAYHPFRRLDYVLTSPKIKVQNYRVLNFPFSDHLPLLVDFKVK